MKKAIGCRNSNWNRPVGSGYVIKALLWSACLAAASLSSISARATIIVSSLEDVENPEPGEVTLRAALAMAASGEPIVFDPALNGSTIELSIVGQEHTTLVGELMGMEETPSGPISYLIGYEERDYGRSALYARQDVIIDASALPDGITIRWGGGDEDPARVLAVYGDLTMKNVSITGGRSVSYPLDPDPQASYPQMSTRARGGGLAVWGIATLENCRLYDNACFQPWNMEVRNSREGGVFGGGIYADVVRISDCVISGNALSGAGVSGGGVFAVGGRSTDEAESLIERTAVTGNTIAGIFAYGGGIYSDGGGIGLSKTLTLENCTVATNAVGIYGPGFLHGMGYWRGGGVYMSNGYMELYSCTIVDNAVSGIARTDDLDKPNLAGGVCATIGNAHAVEHMIIGHCIIAGNWVHPVYGSSYNEDIFTGSLSEFFSGGYNCIGTINFDQMLVPVGPGARAWHIPVPGWGPFGPASLCRKHYPKQGDQYGVLLDDVIDRIHGTIRSPEIQSLGVDASQYAVIFYVPKGNAIDQITPGSYSLGNIRAMYMYDMEVTDNFTEVILGRIEVEYALSGFAEAFTTDFEAFLAAVDIDGDNSNGLQPYKTPDGDPVLTLGDARLYGPAGTWPSLHENYPYIEFWHQLDAALRAEIIPGMGPALLDDEAWKELFEEAWWEEYGRGEKDFGTFKFWLWTPESMSGIPALNQDKVEIQMAALDQNQVARPVNDLGDIGAIEFIPITYGPYLIVEGHCNTGDWMGWLNVEFAPWVWCETAQCWFYLTEDVAGAGNGWIYAYDLAALEVYPHSGYAWSYKLSRWFYVEPSGGGWIYIF